MGREIDEILALIYDSAQSTWSSQDIINLCGGDESLCTKVIEKIFTEKNVGGISIQGPNILNFTFLDWDKKI